MWLPQKGGTKGEVAVKELDTKNGMKQRRAVGSGCPPAASTQWNVHLVDLQLREGDRCILL